MHQRLVSQGYGSAVQEFEKFAQAGCALQVRARLLSGFLTAWQSLVSVNALKYSLSIFVCAFEIMELF